MNAQQMKTKNCPTCNRSLPADAHFCGFDCTYLEMPPKVEGPDKVCPKCKKIYPAYAQYCAIEGAALVQSAQTAPKEPQIQVSPADGKPYLQASPGAKDKDVNFERHDTALMQEVGFGQALKDGG